MEAPFGRWTTIADDLVVEAHRDDVLGLHVVIGHAGRRDEEALAVPEADVAGRSLVDAERVHRTAGVDDALAFLSFGGGQHDGLHRRSGRILPRAKLSALLLRRGRRRRQAAVPAKRNPENSCWRRLSGRLTGPGPFASNLRIKELADSAAIRGAMPRATKIEGAPMANRISHRQRWRSRVLERRFSPAAQPSRRRPRGRGAEHQLRISWSANGASPPITATPIAPARSRKRSPSATSPTSSPRAPPAA